MTEFSLRLYDDRLGASATSGDLFTAANRVLYSREGMVTISGSGGGDFPGELLLARQVFLGGIDPDCVVFHSSPGGLTDICAIIPE